MTKHGISWNLAEFYSVEILQQGGNNQKFIGENTEQVKGAQSMILYCSYTRLDGVLYGSTVISHFHFRKINGKEKIRVDKMEK